MRKIESLLITDTHLEESTKPLNQDIFSQAIDICLNWKIKKIRHLGDIFESRKAQTQDNLKTIGTIFREISDEDISIEIIPGNHDKTSYLSEDSFLSEYLYHPKTTLIESYKFQDLNKIRIHSIPYFDEELLYRNYLEKVEYSSTKDNILLTHIGVNGSKNRDGALIHNCLSIELFEKFKYCYSGHYHDQSIIKNFTYIGSAFQANFSEDENKGFSVLFEDGTIEFLKSNFKPYEIIDLDLEKTSLIKLNEILEECKTQNSFFRFELTGKKEQLDSLNTQFIQKEGFSVKKKYPNIEFGIQEAIKDEFVAFNQSSLKSEFEQFTKENKLDLQKGLKYFNQIIEKNKR